MSLTVSCVAEEHHARTLVRPVIDDFSNNKTVTHACFGFSDIYVPAMPQPLIIGAIKCHITAGDNYYTARTDSMIKE